TGLSNSWQWVPIYDARGTTYGQVHGLATGRDGQVYYLANGYLHKAQPSGIGSNVISMAQGLSAADIEHGFKKGGNLNGKVSKLLKDLDSTVEKVKQAIVQVAQILGTVAEITQTVDDVLIAVVHISTCTVG